MTNWWQELPTRAAGTPAKRRTLLQAGAGTGLLLAAGVPTFVLADGDQPGSNQLKNLDVTGPASGNTTGMFRGKLTVKGFYAQGNQVFALGFVRGSVFDAAGNELQRVQGAATGPVAFQPAAAAAGSSAAAPAAGVQQATTTATSTTSASCQILNLILGPLNLNLLGLVITIPLPIILNITAVPGPGNLLGNLLCDVANLLNGTPLDLSAIINDLNNILAGLGL